MNYFVEVLRKTFDAVQFGLSSGILNCFVGLNFKSGNWCLYSKLNKIFGIIIVQIQKHSYTFLDLVFFHSMI